jgi:hypothetical protein
MALRMNSQPTSGHEDQPGFIPGAAPYGSFRDRGPSSYSANTWVTPTARMRQRLR